MRQKTIKIIKKFVRTMEYTTGHDDPKAVRRVKREYVKLSHKRKGRFKKFMLNVLREH